ncbi:MAG: ComEC/Rec2 family competence protein [Clostridia bacterium]|nr:ComEC/Rec2 family competence protein [Clostridia bacterium]
MKRPLAVAGFTLMISLVSLCIFGNIGVSLLAGAAAYILFMVTSIIPESRSRLTLPVAFFTVLVACLMFYCAQSDYQALADLADTDAQIVCRVKEKPVFNESYGRHYCKAKVISIDGEKYKGNIRLSFNTTYDEMDLANFETGNKLSFKGHLYQVGGEDKGIVDYFKSENVYIGAYGIKDLSVLLPEYRPLSYYGEKLREFIAVSLHDNFSKDTAGFLTALITGSKDYISERIYDTFKNSGVAHIMAVSGMHLAVLVMFLNLFISKLRKKYKGLYFTVLAVFIIFFMFLASFSASVVRAGVMILILLSGQLINKQSDSLNSLGFACICILAVNPFSSMSAGFLLSVLSTLAIILCALPFYKRYRFIICDRLGLSGRVTFYICSAVMLSLAISFSIMMFTLGVSATLFGGVSLISPVTNLLFLPVTTVIIILAFISAILCSVGIMPEFFAFTVEKISSYCLWVAEIFGGTDRFVLRTDSALSVGLCFLAPFAVYLVIKAGKYLRGKIKKK